MPTLFSGLLDHSFRAVSFPATQFRMTLRHDLAIHKMVDKDGAEIEGTGRAPLQFEARIPFINGLARGPNELWQEPLYPTAFREFVDAIANKATGVLNHPEFGPINVKTEHATIVWDGTAQGGVFVDVAWIETVVNILDAANFIGSASPVAQIADAAATLDQAIRDATFATPTVPKLPEQQFSFQDLTNSIRAIADAPSLLSQQVGGKIDAIFANASDIEQSLSKVSNPLNWPLVQAIQAIKAASNDLRETILAKKRALGLWPVKADATLAAIATDIGAPMGDLFVLNPSLLRSPVVPAGSTVRYYASAA